MSSDTQGLIQNNLVIKLIERYFDRAYSIAYW